MPDHAQPARDAAEEIVKRIRKGAPDLDLCLVTQGGDCRDFKGCEDHATTVLAAIIERHDREHNNKAMLHYMETIEEYRKKITEDMAERIVSVITWHRYDGTPKTLPDDCMDVAYFSAHCPDRMRVAQSDLVHWREGDVWAYSPKLPTPSPHVEQGR